VEANDADNACVAYDAVSAWVAYDAVACTVPAPLKNDRTPLNPSYARSWVFTNSAVEEKF
jgi:hypothetical protein